MERNKQRILFSLILLFLVFVILFVDLTGFFNYSDVPFLIGFSLYFLFLFIQKVTGKVSFVMALFLLLYMGISYIPTGAGRITERIGEWFYLFFVAGLIQYTKEAWTKPHIQKKY